jgi:S-formylglutathione hydrolase FrmB
MGGFGAIKIALSNPGAFAFAGALSPAIDVPRRAFSFRRVQQSRAMRSIFGPWDSETRPSRPACTKRQWKAVLQAFDQVNHDHEAAAKILGLLPNYLHKLIQTMNLKPALERTRPVARELA